MNISVQNFIYLLSLAHEWYNFSTTPRLQYFETLKSNEIIGFYMYELIIVGGGPAGMAAAVYAARKLLNTVLVTSDIGGQVNLTNGVENYMGYQFIEGDELISKFQQQVNQFPIDQKIGQKVTRIEKVKAVLMLSVNQVTNFRGK